VATQPDYGYRSAHWHAAGAALEALKHLAPPPPLDAPAPLSAAQGRIFLADDPLSCLAAPAWMVPVVTADPGYPACQDPAVIARLHERFGQVEAWCDCVPAPAGTPYSAALQLMHDRQLQGAWGQCESQAQFDAAVAAGATRLVGKVDQSVLGLTDSVRAQLVATARVLVVVEMYAVDPAHADWRNLNRGIGGWCIATYQDKDFPQARDVADFSAAGLYAPRRDSVYAGGGPKPRWAGLGQ